MEEILKDILPKLGMPSIFITSILIILRSNPITILTSNPIERKLLSKEKQFLIKALKFIFEVIITVLLLYIISDNFFKNKKLYNGTLVLVLSIIVLAGFACIIFLVEKKHKSFNDLFSNVQLRYRIPIFVLFILLFLGYYFLGAYFVGTQLYSDFYNKSITGSEQIVILIASCVLFLLYSIGVLIPVSKIYIRFLGFDQLNPDTFNNKPIYIEIDGERWYLYNLVNEDLFYLANKAHLNSSNRFRFIEKKDLLKQTFEIESEDS